MGIKSSADRIMNRLTQRIKYIKIGGRSLGDFVVVFVSGIIPALYLLVIFLYSGGVVNGLLEGSRANLGGIPVIPNRSAQSTTEVVLNAFVLTMGTAAIYLMYRGGRQTMGRRLGNSYIIGGIVLLLLSFIVGITLLRLKGFQ